jgi:SOS response regulatory protein OraA/RecX
MRLLQRRLAQRRRNSERPEPTEERPGARGERAAAGTRASVEEVRRRVAERIAGLDAAERSGARAAQILVESVLVWEFGEEVLDDPEFAELTRQVRAAMTDDPQVWRKLQGVLADF